jgi:hypothetical protein
MIGNRSLLLAVLLIGVGVFLLLQRADVITDDVDVGPLVLIGIGVFLLIERIAQRGPVGAGYVAPLVVTAIGVGLLLEDVGAFDGDGVLVPLVAIAIGAGLILGAVPSRR